MAVIIEQMKYAVDEDGIMTLPQRLGLEVGCEYILTENVQGKEYISTAIAQLYEEEGTEVGVTLLFEQAVYFPRYILSINPELVEMLGAGTLIQIVGQSTAFTDYNKWTFSLHKAETEDDTEDTATYRWKLNSEKTTIESVGNNDNPITVLEGGIVDGVFQNARYKLATPFKLAHDKDWALEWRMSGTVQNAPAMAKLWADTEKQTAIDSICYVGGSKNNAITITRNGSTHIHYGVDLVEAGIDYTAEHLYRLENRFNDDGANMVWLCVDGTDIATMTHSFSTSADYGESDWVSGRDFSFGFMGVPRYILTGFIVDDISVWESGASDPIPVNPPNPTAMMMGYMVGQAIRK